MQRSKLPYFFLALAAVISVTAIVVMMQRLKHRPPVEVVGDPPVKSVEPTAMIPGVDEIPVKLDPQIMLEGVGTGIAAVDPAHLVARIGKALEAGDLKVVITLVGKDALDEAMIQQFKELSTPPLRLRQPDGVREVGELELNARTRWALVFEGLETGRDRIYLDLKREGEKWTVEKIALPPGLDQPVPKASPADSLGIADAFLQAVLKQDFESARWFVDPAIVSDAKIAGLCILFEEGNYRMRKVKPLRALYNRKDAVGYLANVESSDASQTAQFAIALRQMQGPSGWMVAEINLDQMLADYASRVAGGDLFYSPLVKNPAGGDTLALYFDFDEDVMDPRTRRQLEIVTMILKSDPGKKITLSGHTDARGEKSYNDKLSARRADTVRAYLTRAGVDATQIQTVAKGASQPRRPNLTESGDDNPEGRRANRRTEIYLDF